MMRRLTGAGTLAVVLLAGCAREAPPPVVPVGPSASPVLTPKVPEPLTGVMRDGRWFQRLRIVQVTIPSAPAWILDDRRLRVDGLRPDEVYARLAKAYPQSQFESIADAAFDPAPPPDYSTRVMSVVAGCRFEGKIHSHSGKWHSVDFSLWFRPNGRRAGPMELKSHTVLSSGEIRDIAGMAGSNEPGGVRDTAILHYMEISPVCAARDAKPGAINAP